MAQASRTEARKGAPFPIVGVGASAGGLEAIQELLRALPTDTGMGFVIVQHLSPTHESMLREILARATEMEVVEVKDEPEVQPNHVYVIPPNRGMGIAHGVLSLLPRGEGGMQHRPADQFFIALAEDMGHRAIGVVLSGTGTDGTRGLQAIKAEGGITFAQDASAQQDSMPRSAVAAGCVDFVLAPRDIAKEIVRIAHHPFVGAAAPAPHEERAGQTALDRILGVLRQATGVDFTQYKFNTLFRRISRRAVLLKLDGLEQYAAFLQRTPAEVEALYQDILINVTSFFRNPEAFEALKSRALPRITGDRGRNDPIRVWVVGCSTGEEAYSVAITIAEYLSDAQLVFPVQIYATDLNGAAIDRARAGFYSKAAAHDVSPERLRRFFIEADGGYRISKAVRDMCVFARHNVLADPPFSRMDLICCRNVLIYIEQRLQKRLLPVLHYALKPHAFLMLGGSETIGGYRELFDLEHPKAKLYSKRSDRAKLEAALLTAQYPVVAAGADRRTPARAPSRDMQADIQREADRLLMSRYVPAGVLVNADLEVLQFRGDTGMYLRPAPGKASLNVLKMAREGLLVALQSALHRAKKEDAAAREEGVQVRSNGGMHEIDVVVIPVKGEANEAGHLVLFEDRARRRTGVPAEPPEPQRVVPAEDKDRQLLHLTQELAATREYLQSVIEQQEAANEELQSANEEVQSANEELQSINEELETSKEEIQSSNEELTTVNEELQNRNEELNRANNDFANLLISAQMPIVMVWPDLRIRRFTPMAERLLNLIPADVGRPIGDIKLNLDVPDVTDLVREVIDSVSMRELEVRDKAGRWQSLRIRPYRTMDNKIDGAVIVLVDIHELKRSQETTMRQASILERTHEPIIVRELGGDIVYWNRGAELLYGYGKGDAVGRNSHELLRTTASIDTSQLEEILARDGKWSGELTHRTRNGAALIVESSMAVIKEGEQQLVIETNRDITERKGLEDTLRKRVSELAAADQQKTQFIAMLAHELRNPLAPMRNGIEIMRRRRGAGAADPDFIDMLHRQVSKMTRIVDDLLEVARMTRIQITLRRQPVVLQDVLRSSVETVRPALTQHRLDLDVRLPVEPVVLQGDATRLEQVFCNLLENSAKFTPDGGRVVIELSVEQGGKRPGRAVVSVSDDGVGISAELLPRVFDLFVQADQSLAHSSGGLGIGLSLVRALVERHGGTVSARSEGIGRGSEFMVHLPLAEDQTAPEQQRTEQPAAHPSLDSERVLLVDDNDDFRASMATLLGLAGVTVKTAHNGKGALELTAEFRPTSVLLDLGLPDMDGYEVARRLRSDARLRQPMLIAVTGYGDEDTVARVRKAGFDHHLVKPVEADQVLALLGQSREAVPE